MFAGARGFDGGVEREEVGLLGDFADDGGDAPDLPHLFREPSHLSGGGFHVPGDAFDLGRCGRHRLAAVLGAQELDKVRRLGEHEQHAAGCAVGVVGEGARR